jgi:hypothetical protein
MRTRGVSRSTIARERIAAGASDAGSAPGFGTAT